jgi:ankyrin repeat protein
MLKITKQDIWKFFVRTYWFITTLCTLFFVFQATSSSTEKIFRYIDHNDVKGLSHYLDLYPEKIDNVRFPQDKELLSPAPLQQACEEDKFEIVKLLVEKGANINNLGIRGVPSLIIALDGNKPNRLKIAKYLIENNADFTLYKHNQLSPLNLVLKNPIINSREQKEELEFLKFLYTNEYYNYYEGTKHGTVLHSAAVLNNVSTLQYLVEHRISVDIRGGMKRTPLMYAAFSGSKESLIYLLENGANKYLYDRDGKTALDLAISGDYQEIVSILTSNN